MNHFKLFLAVFCLISLMTQRDLLAAKKKSVKKGLASGLQVYEEQKMDGVSYRLMSPLNFDSSKKYPIIVSLHGAGGRGSDNRKQLKPWNAQLADEKIRSEYPAYVLAPQSTDLWDEADLKSVKAIIASMKNVDQDRIYVLGHSMGGHGTFIFIQLDQNYFAAAAPSAATGLKSTEKFIDAKKIKNIPIWTFHGEKDKTCPYAKVLVLFDELKSLDGNMKLTTWKDGNHGVSDKFIPGEEGSTSQVTSDDCDPEQDFLKWLFAQKLSDRKQQ
ncbi:dienelactone hydrolase family protein [Lentisphaera profundi]|uniref:Dienelactone hydrolase family protein n=1 Tax=Lentisphaera profundi TaxID=1658616 RepID=A0ABY7VP96_9BACT|nr:prolyl oligopeptidase family serine peptidase [Lentisphaera profundi]WDE95792.1 dienelactone hydrolase family protein [Lentisphaera profundi]